MQKISLILIVLTFSLTKLRGQWAGTNPISTNSHVGIGISTPSKLLEISGNGGNAANVLLQLTNQYSGNGMNEPSIRFDNGNSGTYWDIGAQVSGQEYFRISYKGWQNAGGGSKMCFLSMVMGVLQWGMFQPR